MSKLNGTSPLARYVIAEGSELTDDLLAAINASGEAIVASDAANIAVVGVCKRTSDGEAEVESGVFSFANSATNPLARTHRGELAYVEDGETVSADGGTNKVVAGIVVDVYDGEVFVEVSPVAIAVANSLVPAAE